MVNVPWCHKCNEPDGMGNCDWCNRSIIRHLKEKIEQAETSREADMYRKQLEDLNK